MDISKTYLAADSRYETMAYPRCGRSGLRLPRMQELVVTDRNGDHAAAPFRRRLAVHSPPDGVSA